MKRVIFVLLIAVTGCTSLQTEISQKINIGDSKERVLSALGLPSYSGQDGIIYERRSQVCGIALQGGAVSSIDCMKNARYINPVSAILKGMGDGMQKGSQGTDCWGYQTGGTVNLSCH